MKALPVLLLLPTAALAHPGDHSGFGLPHALTAPDHLAILAAVVAGVVWLAFRAGWRR